MNRIRFWKSFKLGEELDIAGRFIFNGLRAFHEMESLHDEGQIFEVLYNLAVGLERLLKIVVILVEHNETVDQKVFEDSLKTHNHPDLLRRIKAHRKVTLGAPENKLLHLLYEFYDNQRYHRFNTRELEVTGKDKTALRAYLSKHLEIPMVDEFPVFAEANTRRIRAFIGHRVGKIAQEMYRLIQEEALRLNIFTYEIRWNSKAAKIFLRNENDFEKEELLWRELIVFFVNSEEGQSVLDYIRKQVPLDFDPERANAYLQSFSRQEQCLELLDELSHLYGDLVDPEARKSRIELIGERRIIFEEDFDGKEVE